MEGGLNLVWQELLGLTGGFLTTASFIPQAWRLFKLKSAHEISLTFNLLLLVGVALWTAYGIALGLLSVILWNFVTFLIVGGILFAKLRYGR